MGLPVEDNGRESRPGNRVSATRRKGGKSGLHRAGCQVIPGGREPTESATEKIPPVFTSDSGAGKGEMVR